MRKVRDWFEKGTTAPLMLAATAFIALAAVFGITILPDNSASEATMRIEPLGRSLIVGDTFEVEVIVDASVQVNVFAGELRFNPEILRVESLDYNTSIANLWAELPWYSNGEGTMNFGGGTTEKGGFQGSGVLVKITFMTMGVGEGVISMYEPKIFLHDGLGTEANLNNPKDAIFTVNDFRTDKTVPVEKLESETEYKIVPEPPSLDLNGDGKQSIADISIFMLNITGEDPRYDFNLDGEVNLKDLNILMSR